MNISSQHGLQELWKKNILVKLWSDQHSKPVYYTDLIFKCYDGSIEAHKVWVSKCCSVVGSALTNIHTCFEQFITVVVPDFSIRVVQKFLKLFYTGSVVLKSYVELEEIKEFGCNQLGLSMSFDQLKFESLAVTEESNPLNNLPDIVIKRRRPTMPSKKLRRIADATPQYNPTYDYELSQPITSGTTPSRFEQTKYNPKKFKPNFELEQGNDKDKTDYIVDQMKTNQASCDREDIYNDNQDIRYDMQSVSYESGDLNLTNTDDENDFVEIEGARVGEELNGNEAKKIPLHSKIDFGMTLPKNNSKLSCGICQKSFLKENRLKNHMNSAHKDLRSKTEAVIEEANAEEAINESFDKNSCAHCGKTFLTKRYLKYHMLHVHSTDPIDCIVCKKTYKNKLTLNFHMKHKHKLTSEVMIYT